ncbi:MAG: hypothetical protein ABW220_14845 [Burkholderiaceae bacterium]
MNDYNDNANQVASDVKAAGDATVDDAITSGKAYAKKALNSTGRKIETIQSQLEQAGDYCVRQINADPVRAVAIAALASAAVTALVVSALRSSGSSRFD